LGASDERQAARHVNPSSSGSSPLFPLPVSPRRVRDSEGTLTEAIVNLAAEYARYGYPRIKAMLRTQGWHVNAKRVLRVGGIASDGGVRG
jgi:hypothetical protein